MLLKKLMALFDNYLKKSLLLIYIICISFLSFCSNKSNEIKSKQIDKMTQSNNLDTATFGAGCFWCVEAIFSDLKGVESVIPGYSGGHTENPDYKEVCTGTTGHAEVCQIIFDPAVIKYSELLEVFWTTHDPTTPNRQGNDVGDQYRSVIYYHNETQKSEALFSKENVATKIWDDPIVTQIVQFTKFFKAEEYHQDYFKDNPNQGYCKFVIEPKVLKFRKIFKDKLKSK